MWKKHYPLIRAGWDVMEGASVLELRAVRRKAECLMDSGKEEAATDLLTDFTNERLHRDYLGAQEIYKNLQNKK